VGDGDFMMIMQELSTMAQYDIPVVIVLADNSGWMAIRDLQMDVLGKDCAFGNDFERNNKPYSPDFYEIGKAFGIDSYKANSEDTFAKALKEAISKNKPAMIVSEVSREYPFTGGKAFGWWDVPIPSYMTEKRETYENSIKEETL
jgi:acetolactate synthase-1/2/3 large subunit